MQPVQRNATTYSLLQESAPEDHFRALGRPEQLPPCALCAVPLISTDSSVQADQAICDLPKQIQLSTALADSQSPSVSTPTDSSSESADCCPPAADASTQIKRALSKKAAVASLRITLLLVLLSVLRICSYIKAAALSRRHQIQSTAAAPAVAGSIIGSWCASTSSFTSCLCVWLASQAQRGGSSLKHQAKTLGPQLLLTLLWILALTLACKTDAQGGAVVCIVTSLPTVTCIAADTRAGRAIQRAAAAAASQILTAPAAAASHILTAPAPAPPPSPSLLKLAGAHATACLAARCKCLERPRSVTSTVSLHLSSSGRQAMQACAAYSKSAVTVMTSLLYIALGCGLLAAVMTLPGLILNRCAMLLVQCWPCLLVLLAYKVTAVCCIRLSVCQALNDALLQCIVICILHCSLLYALTAAAVNN